MSVTASTLATLGALVGGRWWPLTWVLTRVGMLVLLAGPYRWVTGDLHYFADSLDRLAWVGLDRTLVEYPLPGVALLALPWLVVQALLQDAAYVGTVVALAVGTDAAFALLLHRYAGPSGRTAAVGAWVLAVPLLGVTAYARFDLVPGVMAGGAVLLLARHPRVAAAGAVAAAGLKLWPALLLPALAAPRGTRVRVLLTAAVLGGGLVVTSLALAGWDRLLSPLTWQTGRGLQIESVAGTPAMVGWAMAPERYRVGFGDANAYEVAGPGVGALLTAGDVGTLLLLGTLAVLWWRSWRAPGTRPGLVAAPARELVVWSALLAATGLVVTSKVLSPQYLLWLLPLAAAGLAVAPSRRLVRWTAGLLVVAGLTQLVFPVLYEGLVMARPWSGAAVLVLAVRNALLVHLTLSAARAAFTTVSAAGRSSATRRDRRTPAGGASGGATTTPE